MGRLEGSREDNLFARTLFRKRALETVFRVGTTLHRVEGWAWYRPDMLSDIGKEQDGFCSEVLGHPRLRSGVI